MYALIRRYPKQHVTATIAKSKTKSALPTPGPGEEIISLRKR